jgi:hypothetical protein
VTWTASLLIVSVLDPISGVSTEGGYAEIGTQRNGYLLKTKHGPNGRCGMCSGIQSGD